MSHPHSVFIVHIYSLEHWNLCVICGTERSNLPYASPHAWSGQGTEFSRELESSSILIIGTHIHLPCDSKISLDNVITLAEVMQS